MLSYCINEEFCVTLQAVSVIEDVIESAIEKVDGKSSPLPQDSITVDTARSSQQGAGIMSICFFYCCFQDLYFLTFACLYI